MSTTHTKGQSLTIYEPWKTGEGEFSDQVFLGSAEGDDWGEWLICETGGNTANAALIAEAGTVAHETGKTPRQLAEEHKALLDAVKIAVRYMPYDASAHTERARVNAAIAKAEGRD